MALRRGLFFGPVVFAAAGGIALHAAARIQRESFRRVAEYRNRERVLIIALERLELGRLETSPPQPALRAIR